MNQLKIINENYYKALIGILGILILHNFFTIITTQNLVGILPISIQSVLVYLLITKNTLSQKVNKIWIAVVFFGAQLIKILSLTVQVWAKYMKEEDSALEMLVSNRIIYSVMLIIFGIIFWILNRDFGELEES